MQNDPNLEDRAQQQAERLRDQLDALEIGWAPLADLAALQRVTRSAADLRRALALLPSDVAGHLLSAELGFMPGPAAQAFLARHRDDWDGRLAKLHAGAQAAQQWSGPDGQEAYRQFLIRGYVRGFAHLWREATGQPAEPQPGSAFFEFAARWLEHADVTEDHETILLAALSPGWRTGDD
jgi:hypothetical protein